MRRNKLENAVASRVCSARDSAKRLAVIAQLQVLMHLDILLLRCRPSCKRVKLS